MDIWLYSYVYNHITCFFIRQPALLISFFLMSQKGLVSVVSVASAASVVACCLCYLCSFCLLCCCLLPLLPLLSPVAYVTSVASVALLLLRRWYSMVQPYKQHIKCNIEKITSTREEECTTKKIASSTQFRGSKKHFLLFVHLSFNLTVDQPISTILYDESFKVR